MTNQKRVTFAMLGPTSSGKTVAGCALYHMMSGSRFLGKGKFHLDAYGADVTDLNKRWREIASAGKFPAGSTTNRTYDFFFSSNGTDLCEIEWLDYKGALIYERRADISTAAFDKVLEELQKAAVLVILISGNVLNSYIEFEQLKAKQNKTADERAEEARLEEVIEGDMSTYQGLFRDINKDEKDNRIRKPIVFLVTKSDLVKVSSIELMKYFKQMLGDYQLNTGHKVILSQCTLGRELSCDANTISNVSTIMPEGFEFPLLFVVGYRFSSEGNKWYAEQLRKIAALETNKAEKKKAINNIDTSIDDTYTSHSGIFGRFADFLTRKTRQRQRANLQELKNNALEQLRRLEDEIQEQKRKRDAGNEDRKVVESILDYIEAKSNSNDRQYAIYLNEKGEPHPLRDFFA